jgi:hypothetical protein
LQEVAEEREQDPSDGPDRAAADQDDVHAAGLAEPAGPPRPAPREARQLAQHEREHDQDVDVPDHEEPREALLEGVAGDEPRADREHGDRRRDAVVGGEPPARRGLLVQRDEEDEMEAHRAERHVREVAEPVRRDQERTGRTQDVGRQEGEDGVARVHDRDDAGHDRQEPEEPARRPFRQQETPGVVGEDPPDEGGQAVRRAGEERPWVRPVHGRRPDIRKQSASRTGGSDGASSGAVGGAA